MRVLCCGALHIILILNLPRFSTCSISEIIASVKEIIDAAPSIKVPNTTEMLTGRGYVVEEYEVITQDKYILSMIRMKNTGPVVFLMHGFISSSDDWVTVGMDCLPCLLSDAGYDVYFGNARGNKYSRKHTHLYPQEKIFWNFTFHEIGYYDVAAMIDTALNLSNKSQLTYIGHSEGTMAFFVLTSLKPEYNTKVNVMVSMATIAWLSHLKAPLIRILLPLRTELFLVLETLGYYKFLSDSTVINLITRGVCPLNNLTLTICAVVLFTVIGFDFGQLNYTQLPVIYSHIPAGSSTKQALHTAQLIANKGFRQFDYISKTTNIEKYGSEVPPSYPVGNITTPIAIMYGENDFLSSFQDVQILISKLSNVVEIYKVPDKMFNHLDFLWAKDVKVLVYDKVLKVLEIYN